MGGKGSGRLSKEAKIVKQLSSTPSYYPPAKNEFIIPNHSGISTHPEFIDAITYKDDKKLYFGTDNDCSIEFKTIGEIVPIWEFDNTSNPLQFRGDVKLSDGTFFSSSYCNFDSKVTIDVTDTEAFLVRKNNDNGDLLTVDTTNSDVTVNGNYYVTGVTGLGTSSPTADTLDVLSIPTSTSGTTFTSKIIGVLSPTSAPTSSRTHYASYVSTSTGNTNPSNFVNLVGQGMVSETHTAQSSTVGSLYGGLYSVTNRGSGTVSNMYGLNIATRNTGTGTTNNVYGLYINPSTMSSTGAMTNTFGAYISNQGYAGKTTSYGLYVAPQSGSTSNYGIYSAGGNNVLLGTTYLGSTSLYVRSDGSIKPASLSDASASNDSIYYSTTQGKLVYKDSGGTVNSLY